MAAGLAAEDAEFMLHADDLELAGIQEVRRPGVLFQALVVDVQANRRRILVGLPMVGHRHDAGLHARPTTRRPPAADPS